MGANFVQYFIQPIDNSRSATMMEVQYSAQRGYTLHTRINTNDFTDPEIPLAQKCATYVTSELPEDGGTGIV